MNVTDGNSTNTITQNTVHVSGAFANDGTLTANTALNVDAGAILGGTGDLIAKGGTNDGTVYQNDVTLNGASYTNNGTMTSVGTFTNSAAIDGSGDLNVNDGSSSGTIAQGNVTVSGAFNNNASMTVNDTLIAYTGSALTNTSSISATTVDNYGTYTNSGAASSLTASNLNNYKDIINEGTTNVYGTTLNVPEASVTNKKDFNTTNLNNYGTFTNFDANSSLVTNVIQNQTDASIVNNGTATAYTYFANAGTVTGTGTLNVTDGYSSNTINQGTVNIAANTAFDNNAALTATDALTVATGSTLNNSSNITVANATPAVTPANLNNAGTINNTANSTITADTLTNTNGTINLTKSKVAIVYQSDDIKGVVNVLGTDVTVDKSELSITGTKPNFAGTLNVGDVADASVKSALTLTSGNVVEDAIVSIATGNVMNVNGANASLVLDNADVYAGDLNLVNGSVEMKNLTLTTGDVSTTDPAYTGTNPYYTQTGGALTLTNTQLSMVNSSLINGGDLTVDTNSTFNSLANAFTVDNLTNAGLINGINDSYENYAVNTGLYAGDNLGDKQGDFTTDLYARSNSNKNYDSYGSDGATIYASDASKHGILNVSDWTLHGDIFGWDAPIDRDISMDKLFKGSVAADHTIDFTSTNKEVFTPIGWYGLHSAGNGNYSFGLNRFNPGVFRGQITKLAQYQNQLMIDDMLFNHTMLDQGFKGNDYIVSNPNRLASAGDLYPPYQYSRKDGGLWIKMYGTFEKLNMNHGLDVGNNAYGTIIGADFGLKELRHGWQFMPTAYIGYNGAHQYWNGYGAYQNGGQLGFMGTWYKNDFMIGALAYGGVYNNEMSTPRSNDNALGYFAGGAVKTAYNWRFAKDWSLQPNFLVAYNFFGKENWHTDFGQMGMMSGMLNGINIAPGLNLIWEKETFSIYATLQYMYNINQSVGGRAGNVRLPNVHMDRGYIQYGIGFNKRFGERFSGFLQAVFRNAGRTGVGLQAGFQWQLGKGSSKDSATKGDVTPKLKDTKVTLNGKG